MTMKFKLLAGQHVGNDYSAKPKQFSHPETGELIQQWPSKTYHAGDVVESDVDLVAKHGGEKFQLIEGGNRAMQAQMEKERKQQIEDDDNKKGAFVPEPPRLNPGVAPGGQVGSGKQEATGQKIQRETGIGSKPDHEYHEDALEPGAAEDESKTTTQKKEAAEDDKPLPALPPPAATTKTTAAPPTKDDKKDAPKKTDKK